jgi:uncharacterized protein YoaH (UPF0181 family)
VRRAAIVYNVLKATLQRRRAGTQLTRNTYPKLLALTKAEDQVLMQCIKKLNAQGLALTLYYVKDIANQLRAAHNTDPVSL